MHRTLLSLLDVIRSAVPELRVAMTTNGQQLFEMAHDLRRAGLERLNISLDTLDPENYRKLTGGELRPVLNGLDKAIAEGFPPPKINTVVLRGVNDHEIVGLVQWAFGRGCEIRFLEAMPIGSAAEFNRRSFVPAAFIRRTLAEAFHLNSITREPGETAVRYQACGGRHAGIVGIISPVSESFCTQCRRIRITAEGRLYPCLLDSRWIDLRSAWRGDRLSTRTLEMLIQSAVAEKQPIGSMRQQAAMVTLGG